MHTYLIIKSFYGDFDIRQTEYIASSIWRIIAQGEVDRLNGTRTVDDIRLLCSVSISKS